VTATLEIDLRLACQAVVDNHPKPIDGSEGGHGTRLAIVKERFNLFLVDHVHVGSELLSELAELDVAGGRQYRDHEATVPLEDHCLGQAVERYMACPRTLQSCRRMWMFHHIVLDASFGEILRECNCNAPGFGSCSRGVAMTLPLVDA
jgi:hypothetical protein